MTLAEYFSSHPRAALAFSGGVDSAYLLWAGKHYGCDLTAYYVHTAFQPEFEFRDAQRLAEEVGVPMVVVEADILSVPLAAANGPDRCYHCKRALFTKLWEHARRDGHTLLLDGTNASDDAGDRPGMKALRELAVDKPAYACLATRVPTGRTITKGDLERVEKAEDALFALGFTDFRVRLLADAARIQLPADQWDRAVGLRKEILAALKPWFSEITLDLETR